jgi:hypothetical protein
MQNIIRLNIHRREQQVEQIDFGVRRMFNAGWAGSDPEAVQHHIDELAELGVPAPKHVPTLFALGNFLLTTSESIQVHGEETSGEVEYVLLWHKGELLVTVGSDHSDRKLEVHSIPKAKNMCLNVMAKDVWPYEEVEEHFADLELSCSVTRRDQTLPYQQGRCSALLQPSYWIDDVLGRAGGLTDGLVFFSGTIGTVQGLVVGERYEFSMQDPMLHRTLSHRYKCEVLTGAIEDY